MSARPDLSRVISDGLDGHPTKRRALRELIVEALAARAGLELTPGEYLRCLRADAERWRYVSPPDPRYHRDGPGMDELGIVRVSRRRSAPIVEHPWCLYGPPMRYRSPRP